jgi:ATP-binding cassette subfamily C (CFTR/MRP) protein 4
VKKTRILVLDEATANVDPATDSLIRETIRSKFSACTVITIAHRLQSIIDNDMILVVDNGEIVEYDHPHVLLQKKDGFLVRMSRQAGDEMLEYLKKVSEEVSELTQKLI